jgi:hypothetical protein
MCSVCKIGEFVVTIARIGSTKAVGVLLPNDLDQHSLTPAAHAASKMCRRYSPVSLGTGLSGAGGFGPETSLASSPYNGNHLRFEPRLAWSAPARC